MLAEEAFEERLIAFADFAEHPSGGFVNEVVPIVGEHFGDRQRVIEIVVADEVLRGDDGDAAFPERFGLRERVQTIAIAFEQMRADDVRCRGVDQIPVVDAMRVRDVAPINLVTRHVVAALVLVNENSQREKARLVPARLQQRNQFRDRGRREFPRQRSDRWDGDPEERVAFAVLAWAALEESQMVFGDGPVGQ